MGAVEGYKNVRISFTRSYNNYKRVAIVSGINVQNGFVMTSYLFLDLHVDTMGLCYVILLRHLNYEAELLIQRHAGRDT